MKTVNCLDVCWTDPCALIMHGIAYSCKSFPNNDFSCECTENFIFNDDSNSCIEGKAIPLVISYFYTGWFCLLFKHVFGIILE